MPVTDKTLIFEARIRILVEKLAEQSSTFDKMQNKMFALVGLLLTLGGLLSSGVFAIKKPDTPIEQIILTVALALLGATAMLIGYEYRTKKNWSTPIGPAEEVKLDNAKDYEEALEIIHDDYKVSKNARAAILDRKGRFLNGALYMFITSVILLLILKIGG